MSARKAVKTKLLASCAQAFPKDVYHTYERKDDINKTCFVDVLPKPLVFLAKMIGFDGGYLRFEGTATVEKLENDEVVEKVSDPAVWELMYFGKSCADEK